MHRLIDAFKMAYVGFFEVMGWDYSAHLHRGDSFSRRGHDTFFESPEQKDRNG